VLQKRHMDLCRGKSPAPAGQ